MFIYNNILQHITMDEEDKAFCFRISPKMRADINKQAEKELRTPSNLVRKLVRDYLEEETYNE